MVGGQPTVVVSKLQKGPAIIGKAELDGRQGESQPA
jgi:hypothetical protein